jgi:hypothetical protein
MINKIRRVTLLLATSSRIIAATTLTLTPWATIMRATARLTRGRPAP